MVLEWTFDKKIIKDIVEKSKNDCKYNGLSVIGTDQSGLTYMSPEYLKYYGMLLDKAQEEDMKICLYDEWWFPSGSAGGQLKRKNPKSCAWRLDKYLRLPTPIRCVEP